MEWRCPAWLCNRGGWRVSSMHRPYGSTVFSCDAKPNMLWPDEMKHEPTYFYLDYLPWTSAIQNTSTNSVHATCINRRCLCEAVAPCRQRGNKRNRHSECKLCIVSPVSCQNPKSFFKSDIMVYHHAQETDSCCSCLWNAGLTTATVCHQ